MPKPQSGMQSFTQLLIKTWVKAANTPFPQHVLLSGIDADAAASATALPFPCLNPRFQHLLGVPGR